MHAFKIFVMHSCIYLSGAIKITFVGLHAFLDKLFIERGSLVDEEFERFSMSVCDTHDCLNHELSLMY